MFDRRSIAVSFAALITCCAVFLVAQDARGAEITMEPPAIVDGYTEILIHLSPGAEDEAAALQFDLQYDTEQFALYDVFPGEAAEGSGKDTVYSDLNEGTIRVIVAGFNQNTLNNGVVAKVYLYPLQENGTTQSYGLQNVVISDPVGAPVAAQYDETWNWENGTETEEESKSLPDDDPAEAPSFPAPAEDPAPAEGQQRSFPTSEPSAAPDTSAAPRSYVGAWEHNARSIPSKGSIPARSSYGNGKSHQQAGRAHRTGRFGTREGIDRRSIRDITTGRNTPVKREAGAAEQEVSETKIASLGSASAESATRSRSGAATVGLLLDGTRSVAGSLPGGSEIREGSWKRTARAQTVRSAYLGAVAVLLLVFIARIHVFAKPKRRRR